MYRSFFIRERRAACYWHDGHCSLYIASETSHVVCGECWDMSILTHEHLIPYVNSIVETGGSPLDLMLVQIDPIATHLSRTYDERSTIRAILTHTLPTTSSVQIKAISLLAGERGSFEYVSHAEMILVSTVLLAVCCTHAKKENVARFDKLHWIVSDQFRESVFDVVDLWEEYYCDCDFMHSSERVDRAEELASAMSSSHFMAVMTEQFSEGEI